MTVAYIPLDERPCNMLFPRQAAAGNSDVSLSLPPRSLIGKKKEAGDPEGILKWLESILPDCDALVVSLEMILYGGLLPSRLHYSSYSELSRRLETFIALIHWRRKQSGRSNFRVYAYGLVMRTPAYSSDDEEPEYYARYGREIFLRAYLEHKEEVEGLSEQETREYRCLDGYIPQDILRDYEGRREINRTLLHDTISHFSRREIDVLLIPQDDTARYGYGPRDWSRLFSRPAAEAGLGAGNLLSYPGADEVGGVLIARSVLEWHATAPATQAGASMAARSDQGKMKIFILPRSSEEMNRIPKYESMSLSESVRLQIQSCGGAEASGPEDAHILLALNTPAEGMSEAPDQEFRDSSQFVERIATQCTLHSLPVIVADTAFPNGGETSLLQELERQGMWKQLLGYAGWNTAGNSLGTALFQGVLSYLSGNSSTCLKNLYYRICDDWAYQSILRSRWMSRLSEDGAQGHVDISSIPDSWSLESKLADEINDLMTSRLPGFSALAGFRVAGVDFPWKRLFEIRLELSRCS